MKTVIQIMVVLIALLFSAYAAEYKEAEIVTVNEGDTLASDLFAGCRHVEVYGVAERRDRNDKTGAFLLSA